MSSILKALRKLEDEKAEAGQGQVDLARDILKRSVAKRRESQSWLFFATGVALLFLAGGVWTYLSISDEPITQSSPTEAVSQSQIAVKPSAPTTSAQFIELSPVRNLKSAQDKRRLSEPSPKKVVSRVPVTDQPIAEAGRQSQPIALPVLNVEEIIYHEDPASRMAVINDLPVMEGTDIDGARVIEILPDRVRLSYQGVEIPKFKTTQD